LTDPEKTLTKAEEDKRAAAAHRAAEAAVDFEPLVFHTWSGVPATGSSKKFLSKWLQRVVENRPGLDRDRKTNEIQEGLSCILFSQIAEQLQTIVGSNEIPVLPNLRIPDWVDPFGNEVGQPPEPKRARPNPGDSAREAVSSHTNPSISGAAIPAQSSRLEVDLDEPSSSPRHHRALPDNGPPNAIADPGLGPIPYDILLSLFPVWGDGPGDFPNLSVGLDPMTLDDLQRLLTDQPPSPD
jgi:hypothetical protein